MEHFTSNLKRYREKAGLTQEELARNSGVSRKTIVLMESPNGADPRLSTIKRLTSYLQITFDELFCSYSKED